MAYEGKKLSSNLILISLEFFSIRRLMRVSELNEVFVVSSLRSFQVKRTDTRPPVAA